MLRKSKSAMTEGASNRAADVVNDAARFCHSEPGTPKETPFAAPPTYGSALATFDRAAAASRRGGSCAIEGTRLLERALSTGLAVLHVVTSERADAGGSGAERRALAAARAAGVPVLIAPDVEVAARTAGRTFGDVLAVVGLGTVPVRELLDAAGPVVALERVLDPGNIGTIARTAAALGYAGLIACEGTDPLHPKALRTSMGALFRLPVAVVDGGAAAVLDAARAAGRPQLATWLGGAPLADAMQALSTARRRRIVVWLGSEAHGLRPETAAAADLRVAIAMPGADGGESVDSLSIGAAAAIALWAAGPGTPTLGAGAAAPDSAGEDHDATEASERAR